LGVGPKSRRFPDIERIVGEASPRTKVTLDSVAITAAVGRPEGGEPRKLTAALDKIREEVAEETFMGDGEDLPDYTDHIASPSSWTTPGERRRIAQDMGLDATSTRAFVADPEAWLHRAFRPEEEGDDDAVLNIEMPQIEIALDEAWHRFFNGSGSTIARKRRSIRLAFGEGGKAEPFDLDGFPIAAGGD
jgi:hypothetical protein